MDKIWDRKSFEVGGHWPLWMGKKRKTTQNRQKSNAKKHKNNNCIYSPDIYTRHVFSVHSTWSPLTHIVVVEQVLYFILYLMIHNVYIVKRAPPSYTHK